MKSISTKSALALALACTLTVGTSLAQTAGLRGSDGIVILTAQNEADVLNAAYSVNILAAVGSPLFFRAHKAEMESLAAAHKSNLLVVYANPDTIEGADQIVSKLTGSAARYPVVIYLGTEARNVSGKIADGVMTGLVNGNLGR